MLVPLSPRPQSTRPRPVRRRPRRRSPVRKSSWRGGRRSIPTSNTIAAKLPLALQETPASVSVVTAELIEQQSGLVLGDALENVSGLNVQTGNGVFDFFVVRGIDSVSGGMILLDGTREPESSFYQLYNVDRVEVLKGPSSFVYGGSSLAGTVNLVRRQPVAQGSGTATRASGQFLHGSSRSGRQLRQGRRQSELPPGVVLARVGQLSRRQA